jgi:serine/threonine protein kinase
MGATFPTETIRSLGKFELIEKLGEGYLGSVFRGFDRNLGHPAAVRVLCEGIKWDARIEELFHCQCQAISGLRHPNIVAVFDVGREGQSRYIAMESLGNRNIGDLIAQKANLTCETKLSIMIQVAEGLGCAHKHGILHLDLTPGKIHLTADGVIKIRDFGLAHVLMKHLPHPIIRWGSPIYLSPEQIQHKGCDARSDIFSAGMVFYELLTYLHPFHDSNSNKALDNILLDAQIPTFEQFPEAHPGVWSILKTCLARDPKDRYQSMDDVSAACRELVVSLSEDSQLMLAELYAALPPLRKAAAQPGASEGIIRLQADIQKLSNGEIKADYASLDRLMTVLIEHYPAIHSASDMPDPINLQLPSIEQRVASKADVPLKSSGEIGPQKLNEISPDRMPRQNSETTLEENAAECSKVERIQTDCSPVEMPDPQVMATVVQEAVPPAAAESDSAVDPEPNPVMNSPGIVAELPPVQKPGLISRYRRKIPRPSYRTTALLLSILVITAAGYIAWGTEAGPIRNVWGVLMAYSPANLKALVMRPRFDSSAHPSSAGINDVMKKAPSNHSSSAPLPGPTPEDAAGKRLYSPGSTDNQTKNSLSQISFLIDSGKLQQAKTEIDKLQTIYPTMPEVMTLRKRWQAKASIQETGRKEEEQQKTMSKQKEDEWSRQVADLFARGKYSEAAGALSLWMSENPGSPRAREFSAKIDEVQRSLTSYASAISENRYPDALGAIRNAEKINPVDPNFAELHRQIETRSTNAKATLTVHRLGAKATLLLDGRPVGREGEIEIESIAAGNHTLAIANDGGLVASRSQEYAEGQRVTLVYDLAKLNLRPMADSDRELVAQRRAMETVHTFELEHEHGLFRSNCRGVLSVDFYDIAYKPSSGWHGFRMPFKLLRLGRVEGKQIELFYISDGKHFQTFNLPDDRAVARFKQVWGELKNLARQ